MNRDHRFVGRFAICALVVIATLELAACGGHGGRHSGATAAGGSTPAPASGLAYGSLPPRGTPRAGGTISVGQVAGSTPSYIFPIIPGANATPQTINLIQNLFLPLYNGPKGASPTIDYGLSIGRPPVFSDGDKTVTIAIKRGFRWSGGTPVDADDMVFEIDLLKAAVADRAANWSQYTPGQFPTSVVSATAPSRYELVIKLDRAYNPNYFLDDQLQDSNGVYPLPATTWNIDRPGGPHLDYTNPANAKKIYDFLSSQGANESGFATNPLWKDVDGPYKLSSFSATDGSYRLAPNPHYGGGPGPYATILATTYPSIAAQLSALRSGGLDVGSIDFAQLGAVGRLRAAGFSVFGGPSFGWLGGVINFEDTTGHFDKIIKQPYVRQALAHLIDQPAYVKSIFRGAAAVNYGPVPNLPGNPFTPANNTSVNGPYPYDPSAAAALLKARGWKVVPNGQSTCQKAGNGAGECGAGIPAGTPLTFNWVDLPRSESPTSALEGHAFASAAKTAIGVTVELQSRTFDYQLANFDDADPSATQNRDDWAIANDGAFFYNYYPASDQTFNTTGVFNAGGFSDARADALMSASVFGPDPNAVKDEAHYLTATVPVLFEPAPAVVYAVSSRVRGDPLGFGALTQQSLLPQYWYVGG
ncbi:MAG: ABC transporter substrate-binding protein [Solirubrobacteraceae bacterium]